MKTPENSRIIVYYTLLDGSILQLPVTGKNSTVGDVKRQMDLEHSWPVEEQAVQLGEILDAGDDVQIPPEVTKIYVTQKQAYDVEVLNKDELCIDQYRVYCLPGTTVASMKIAVQQKFDVSTALKINWKILSVVGGCHTSTTTAGTQGIGNKQFSDNNTAQDINYNSVIKVYTNIAGLPALIKPSSSICETEKQFIPPVELPSFRVFVRNVEHRQISKFQLGWPLSTTVDNMKVFIKVVIQDLTKIPITDFELKHLKLLTTCSDVSGGIALQESEITNQNMVIKSAPENAMIIVETDIIGRTYTEIMTRYVNKPQNSYEKGI